MGVTVSVGVKFSTFIYPRRILKPDLFSTRKKSGMKKGRRAGVCRLLMKISVPESTNLSAVRFLNSWGDLVLAWGENICILPWQVFMPRFLHTNLLLQTTFGGHSDTDLGAAINKSNLYDQSVPSPVPSYPTDWLRNASNQERILVKSPRSWGPSPAGRFTEPARNREYDWSESLEMEYRLSLQNLITVRDDLVALVSPVGRSTVSTRSVASRNDTNKFESTFQAYLEKAYAVVYGLPQKCINGIAWQGWKRREDENPEPQTSEINFLRQGVKTFEKESNASKRQPEARNKRFKVYVSGFPEWVPLARTQQTTKYPASSSPPLPRGPRCFFPVGSLTWEPNSAYLQLRHPQMVPPAPVLTFPTRRPRKRSTIFKSQQHIGSSFDFLSSWEDSVSDTGKIRGSSFYDGGINEIGAYLARMHEKTCIRVQLPPLEPITVDKEQEEKGITFKPRRRTNKTSKWSVLRLSPLHKKSSYEMEFDEIISAANKVDGLSTSLPLLPSFLEPFRNAEWLKATGCFSAPDWPNCPTGQLPDAFVTCYVNATLIRKLLASDGETLSSQLFADLFQLHSTSPLSEETCGHMKRLVLEMFIEDADLSWKPKIRVLVFIVRLLINMGATDVDTFALLLHCLAVVKILHPSDKDLRTILYESLEDAGIPDTKGFLSDELREMLDVRRILVPHTVYQADQGDEETLSIAETHSLVSYLRKWLFSWIVEAKLRLRIASSQPTELPTEERNVKREKRYARRSKHRRRTLQEDAALTAIDAIRAFYSWKDEKCAAVLERTADAASEKTVAPHEVPPKPKVAVCRTLVRLNTRKVGGKLPECIGFHDASRPTFANPWRSYCQAMQNRLPPLMHFRPPMATPMPFKERRQSLESLSQDVDRVRQQISSLVYWFLPELSRVLPCLIDEGSAAGSEDNVSNRWKISRKRVCFLRGEQSRLALSMELDG
ncbi:unnamed protein product [Schistocephalus solidus]|uniref:ULP_PROTEASE domain-containing protein n=1 Tax=Schistocephalus solidus TaxID=70667 RepID=A0A183S872_SCHSO|nr:unnamed protein product [Schistocephalus solidus]